MAPVVELADTQDSGSCAPKACGFDSHRVHHMKDWPLRLSARTSGSHPGKRSSTLLGAALRMENVKCKMENGMVGKKNGKFKMKNEE